MSTNHNRIKVSDLETNQKNKILITNSNGELEFGDIASTLDFKTVNGESILGNGDIDLSNKVDKIEGERLITATEIAKLERIEDGAQVNQDISGKQDLNNQIFVSASGLVQDSWHGKLVIFTANVTITVPPTGLRTGFNFEGIVDPSFTINTVIMAPKGWYGTYTGNPIPSDSIFSFVQRANDSNKISIYGL
ncbi:hypothetical protein [Flavobacterium tistrianum]|uniref:hypothetical protein n=1 Tax=Flavobacterium tistrianum TaxID=1685414 RepID=UPI000DAD3886|nr:hypothetical protein [Flavobacterium tistrianum]KAF2342853.1 hypothetical protein DMB71_01730 [Flavobacterium tistrianum]